MAQDSTTHGDNVRFLVYAARCLHRLGTPAHRLEDALHLAARGLGIDLQISSTPTSVHLAMGEDGSQSYLVRSDPGPPNLGGLIDVDAILSAVAEGTLEPAAATQQLHTLNEAPPRYGKAARIGAFALCSAGASVFFGGGVYELLIAGGLGAMVAVLNVVMAGKSELSRLYSPVAAFMASVVPGALSRMLPLSEFATTISALIVIVPGLTLTVAMTELATRHLVSGTARLMGALVEFLTIAFGIAVARACVELMLPGATPIASDGPLPLWVLGLSLSISPLGFVVLFQAQFRETPWILLAGVAGFIGARIGTQSLGPELGTFVGAVTVGLAANAYSKARGAPSLVLSLPGLLLLVPGSVGFRAMGEFVDQRFDVGLATVFQMMLVGVSLAAGVALANALLSPRRAL